MQQIFDDTDSQPRPGEAHMGALTAADRKMWAEMREEFFMEGVNRASMEVMEKVCVGRCGCGCVCVCVCVGVCVCGWVGGWVWSAGVVGVRV